MADIVLRASRTNFIRLIQPLAVLRDDALFEISKRGVTITVVDPSHICMAHVSAKKEFFAEIKLDELVTEVGIDTEHFLTILNNLPLDYSDEVTLRIDKDNGKCIIHADSDTLRFRGSMHLPNIIGVSKPKIPNLKLHWIYTITSQKKLRQIVRHIIKFCDHLRLHGTKDDPTKLFIQWHDGLGNDYEFILCKSLVKSIDTDPDETEVKAMYPIEYFDGILKGLSRAFYGDAEIKLSFSHDYPIEIHAGKKPFEVMYLLAPRIESE